MTGWRTVAEMQMRELLRRRAALGMLIAIPLTWFLAETASGVSWAIGAGTIGVAWSAGAAALFAVLGGRKVDPRLVQAGLGRPAIVAGRLVALGVAATALALGFAALALTIGDPARPVVVVASMLLAGLVAVPLGWLAAALIPRELEACLLLIGLIGIETSLPSSTVANLLPLYGPLHLTDPDIAPAPVAPDVAQTLAVTAVLAAVAIALWARRVRLAPAVAVEMAPRVQADARVAASRLT